MFVPLTLFLVQNLVIFASLRTLSKILYGERNIGNKNQLVNARTPSSDHNRRYKQSCNRLEQETPYDKGCDGQEVSVSGECYTKRPGPL